MKALRAEVTKVFTFEAAHQLLNHDGKCANPHGHSYTCMINVVGRINMTEGHSKEGMVIDFADIKTVWEQQCKPFLDHQNLNETLDGIVTTAENIAAWILAAMRDSGLPVDSVDLWETASSRVSIKWSEVWQNVD